MATKDGISICSNDSSSGSGDQNRKLIELDDDISTMTLTADTKLSSICKY